MHAAAFAWVQAHTKPRGHVLEIGSRDVNGTVRGLFGPDYVGLDIAEGPGVDVVADVTTYKPDRRFDWVVCCEVLEHTPNGQAICAAAHQLLTEGGTFIVTTATEGRAPHSAVDGGPLRPGEYYANIDPGELRGWLDGFKNVTVDVLGADVRAVAVK